MMEDKSIDELIQILETTTDENTRWRAAYSLGEIATGDDRAILALVKLLETSTNEFTRSQAAESLGQIGKGDERAIFALVNLLENSTNEFTCQQAVDILGEIAIGNETATVALIDILETTVGQSIYYKAMQSLYKIRTKISQIYDRTNIANDQKVYFYDKSHNYEQKNNLHNNVDIDTNKSGDNNITIGGNAKGFIIGGSYSSSIQYTEAEQPDRQQVELSFENQYNKWVNNQWKLVNELITNSSEFVKWKTAKSIASLCPTIQSAVVALENLLNTTDNEFIHWQSIKSLKQISQKNYLLEECTTAIRQYWDSIDNEFIKWQILEDWSDLNISPEANPQSSPNFYIHYNKVVSCIDLMQESRDIFSRRLLINSCLEVHQRIIQFCIQSANVNRAFFYIELFRNRYLVERIAQQDAPLPQTISPALAQQIQTAKQTERKTLQTYTDAISKQRPETELETLSQAWENAKQTLENLYRQVAEIEPEFIAKTKVYPIHFEAVQQLLPADTAIIEFFFTETELITLLILPGTQSPLIPETLRIKLKPNHLKTLADDWKADLADEDKSETKTTDTTIQQLPQRIDRLGQLLNFTHLNQYIPRQIKHLIILPNNYLHLFPIHALPWNENQRLIDRFSVRYFPNLHIWKICQNRQRTRDSFLGIENPTADKQLIFAKAEIASIGQKGNFKPMDVLDSDNAKKMRILQDAKNYHCFHFSGHAEYNFTNPLDSYLMLSEDPQENLTLSTIFTDLHLPNADLATLSACCTGVVDAFQPTDECLGIATGFLLAGAKAVVSSLWKVNSIATAFLLDEFYRQLDQTSDKAVALQKAQNWLRDSKAKHLIQRANEWDLSTIESKEQFRLDRALKRLKRLQGCPFENPYYWAAFILTGF